MATYSSKKYPAGSVTSATLADGTVAAVDLAAGSVGTTQLADTAVTNGKLAADGFDASKFTTGTLPIARVADGAVTAGKLASTLDLTGKTLSLPSAAVTPADGSITQAKVNDSVGGLRPQWTEIRFNGLEATNTILEWFGTGIYVNNGNNGSSARGRLQGSTKGVFRIKFELGYWWGWSEFILYPRDLWDASTSASIDTEPVGRTVIRILNNSSNNSRVGYLWTGSGSTTQWLSSTGTTAVWTAWRDSSNDIRIFDGSTTTLVTNSSEEFVVVSGVQSPHYTRIYEAGSYK